MDSRSECNRLAQQIIYIQLFDSQSLGKLIDNIVWFQYDNYTFMEEMFGIIPEHP